MSEANDKKHILYLITKSNFGGAQRYVYDLATSCSDEYKVSVALGGDGPLKTHLENAGIRVLSIPYLKRDIDTTNDWKVFMKLVRLFKSERPDVIHLNSSKIGGLGAFAGRITGVKNIIFTGHGWAFNEERNVFSKIVIFFFHALTIFLAHKTIAVSEETKRQITSRAPWLKSKMEVVYNAIDDIDFVDRDTARNHLKKHIQNDALSSDDFWIGTVGELHHIKGHNYLIYALSEIDGQEMLSNMRTVIVGNGEEKGALEDRITRRRLKERVFLAGQVQDARRYLKAFDIFVFPSLSEAMPYALLEAGKAGLPIVASDVGGIGEIISNESMGILVDPKDVFALRDAIVELHKNKELRETMSTNIQKHINTRFSHEKMIEETHNVYNKNNYE